MPKGVAPVVVLEPEAAALAVAKIAGLAARDIPGVHAMGGGVARRFGQLRELIPGGSQAASQGVSVDVGERQAAIDLNLVTEYGQSIVDISDAVRRSVAGQVEGMTGLKVVEVNIQVDDIHVESPQDAQQSRAQ
ncbi:MAG: Asp23/Gls24 family envelope stress response protein [Firmicutes bacterium]|nr:Asp23/Gls24 family envelope stress response protein [Bacillota bacterium]